MKKTIMKRLNLFATGLLLMVALFFAGCSDDDDKNNSPIIFANNKDLTQEIYADDKEVKIKFTTTTGWSAGKPTSSRDANPTWLSISPNHGDAGDHEVTITIEPNTTRDIRTAYITITCDGMPFKIQFEQSHKKKDGSYVVYPAKFQVFSCNPEWNPTDDNPYNPGEEAILKVYKGNDLLGDYKANADGAISLNLEKGDYTYTIAKGNEKNILDPGYQIAGIFTSTEETEEIAGSKLGDLKFADLNGDKVINSSDIVKIASFTVEQSDAESANVYEIYIAPQDFKPTYVPFAYKEAKETMNEAFAKILKESYMIDAAITRETALPNPYSVFRNLNHNANTTPIATLWNESYRVLKQAQLIIDNLGAIGGELTEEEMRKNEENIADARLYKTYAYSILANYFGGVPIYEASSTEDIERSSIEELQGIIEAEGNSAIEGGNENTKHQAYQLLARLAMVKKEYQSAFEYTKQIINSGRYKISSNLSWGTDAISIKFVLDIPGEMGKGSFSLPVRYCETLLLNAEAALKLGNASEAMQIINQLLTAQGKPGLQNDYELTAELESLWVTLFKYEGITFGRWMRTGQYAKIPGFNSNKHKLLPLPASAITSNVKQNPGW